MPWPADQPPCLLSPFHQRPLPRNKREGGGSPIWRGREQTSTFPGPRGVVRYEAPCESTHGGPGTFVLEEEQAP